MRYTTIHTLDDESLPFGPHTSAIVDERQGGIIIYCHVGNVDRFAEILNERMHLSEIAH